MNKTRLMSLLLLVSMAPGVSALNPDGEPRLPRQTSPPPPPPPALPPASTNAQYQFGDLSALLRGFEDYRAKVEGIISEELKLYDKLQELAPRYYPQQYQILAGRANNIRRDHVPPMQSVLADIDERIGCIKSSGQDDSGRYNVDPKCLDLPSDKEAEQAAQNWRNEYISFDAKQQKASLLYGLPFLYLVVDGQLVKCSWSTPPCRQNMEAEYNTLRGYYYGIDRRFDVLFNSTDEPSYSQYP